MISKVRENLVATGCADEKLIQKLESEWRNLDASNPQTDIAKMVVTCGQDFGKLGKYFMSTFDLSQNSARGLTYAFGNKASAQLNCARQLKLGITVGLWHASSGCSVSCSHTPLNNRYFFLRKGIKFNGYYILPGEEVNCKCHWTPIIPGLVDENPPEKILDKARRFLSLLG